MIFPRALTDLQVNTIEGLIWRADEASLSGIEEAIAKIRTYREYENIDGAEWKEENKDKK